MLGFLCSHLKPVVVVLPGHAVKAPDGVQCEVDGIELYMCNGMDEHGPAFEGGRRAARHGGVVLELGPGRATGKLGFGDAQCRCCFCYRIESFLCMQINGCSSFFLWVCKTQDL